MSSPNHYSTENSYNNERIPWSIEWIRQAQLYMRMQRTNLGTVMLQSRTWKERSMKHQAAAGDDQGEEKTYVQPTSKSGE